MLNKRIIGFTAILLLSWSWVTCLDAQDTSPTLTIDQAVRMALERNLNLRTARLQITAARARIAAARSERFPSVGTTIQYTHLSSVPEFEIPTPGPAPEPITISAQDNITGVISTRLAVYTGGRIQALVSRAEAQYDATVAQLAANESQIAFRTREAYYAVLLAESSVRSNEQNLAAATAQLESSRARYEVGTVARFDVLRAETQVSEAQQALTQSRNQVETSMVVLNRILGVPLDRVYTLVEPERAPAPSSDVSTLVGAAEHQRAEILSARAQVEAARAGIRIARSELLPELDLNLNYQAVQTSTPTQSNGWTFSAILSWALFNGGRTRANVTEARALTSEAELNVEDTTRAVEQEVRQSWLDVRTALQNIDTARARVAQATDAYDIARVRYEEGVGTATELADALAALAAARTNLDRAMFNYNTAYAALQRALGLVTY